MGDDHDLYDTILFFFSFQASKLLWWSGHGRYFHIRFAKAGSPRKSSLYLLTNLKLLALIY